MADAVLDLELHDKQGEAYTSLATEILYGGAAGGGKSHLMRVAAIMWCILIPGLQVYLFRRTFPDLEKNHLTGPASLPMMLASYILCRLVKYNSQKGIFTFWNNSAIHLCHCQYEKDLVNYQGAEIHVLLIDEITHWTADMYKYLRGRVRLGGLKIPTEFFGLFPRILVSGNPGGIGHNWVKQDFVDNAPEMEIVRMPKEEGGMLRQYIPAKLSDNPTMLETDPDYKDRLSGLGSPALVKAMLDGNWNIVAGGMFDDVFDESIHMIEPFAIPASWRITRAFDWGSSKPFSVGWWAVSDGTTATMADGSKRTFPARSLFRIAEWYGWNGKANVGLKLSDSEIALGILRREKELGIAGKVKPGPADSSIFDEQNADSPAKIQERHNVRWRAADKSPGSRIRGWSLLRARLIAALYGNREQPHLYAFNTCVQFKRTVPSLPRDTNKPEDVDTDAEDHTGDETRYMCLDSGTVMATSINAGFATNA
jgi:hypothetical protein